MDDLPAHRPPYQAAALYERLAYDLEVTARLADYHADIARTRGELAIEERERGRAELARSKALDARARASRLAE